MDDKLVDRLEEKLDKIVDKMGSIDTTLAGQHVQLTDHIRRTELLENKMEGHEAEQAKALAGIHTHVTTVKVFGWLLVTGVPIALGIWKILT